MEGHESHVGKARRGTPPPRLEPIQVVLRIELTDQEIEQPDRQSRVVPLADMKGLDDSRPELVVAEFQIPAQGGVHLLGHVALDWECLHNLDGAQSYLPCHGPSSKFPIQL